MTNISIYWFLQQLTVHKNDKNGRLYTIIESWHVTCFVVCIGQRRMLSDD